MEYNICSCLVVQFVCIASILVCINTSKLVQFVCIVYLNGSKNLQTLFAIQLLEEEVGRNLSVLYLEMCLTADCLSKNKFYVFFMLQ